MDFYFLLFVLHFSLLIPYPDRVFAYFPNAFEFQKGCGIIHVGYSVEHGGHALAAVYATAYYEAHLIQESGGQEGGVDMVSANYGETVNREFRLQYSDQPVEIYAALAAGYPRYALRRNTDVELCGTVLRGYYKQVFISRVVELEQLAVGVDAYFKRSVAPSLVPRFAAYRRRVSSLELSRQRRVHLHGDASF